MKYDYNKYVALDIYTFLFRTAFGDTKEEIDFRVRQGSNGVVKKVLNYINDKYLKENEDE